MSELATRFDLNRCIAGGSQLTPNSSFVDLHLLVRLPLDWLDTDLLHL